VLDLSHDVSDRRPRQRARFSLSSVKDIASARKAVFQRCWRMAAKNRLETPCLLAVWQSRPLPGPDRASQARPTPGGKPELAYARVMPGPGHWPQDI
jgi:hypothetical protein